MNSFTPVYLWRKGNPDYWACAFLESFFHHDPGPDVNLVLLLKGFQPGSLPDLARDLPTYHRQRLEFVWVDDEGMDLAAYRALCGLRADDHLLFLNSHSRLCSGNWFHAFQGALEETKGTALLGASGSYEAGGQGLSFPNPHVRTTGFLIARNDYATATKRVPLITKQDCHELEAGQESLTKFFLEAGRPVLIVNSDGELFDINDWPQSGTFRLKDQEKLIVSDNRSQKYHCGFKARRQHHAHASWQGQADTTSLSWFTSLKRTLWERHLYFGHRLPGRRNIS